MTASAGTTSRVAAAPFPPIPLRRRLYGFGSIYGKTIRDSRLAFIITAGLLGGLSVALPAAIGTVFPSPAARLEINSLIGGMPASMVNLFGNATLMGPKLGTLGGYLTWKYGSLFILGTALWSILALSGTLAGEAARGSLDFVAAAPFGKRRIALEKLAAHLTMVCLALAFTAVMLVVSSTAFGDASLGDQISPVEAVGFVLLIGFTALCFGGLALALAPILGRGGAAGVSAILMVLLWVVSGLDVGGPLAAISPFHWTADDIPLVGIYDWGGLALVGVVGVVFLVIGVELFQRRDLGVTAGLSLPRTPGVVLGVRGPISRAFGDEVPRALSWGIGLFLFGALLTSIVKPMADQIAASPDLLTTFRAVFPAFDLGQASGFLQLYLVLFYIAAGFAAATFVSRWASDETAGRLETVLTTPVGRARWVVAGGIASLLAVVVMTVLFAAGIAAGAAGSGLAASTAIVGTAAMGLYAFAIVGVGVAIGGLWRTSLAGEIAALVVVVTYLIDLLAPPLKLPDWLHQLALTAHLGQPMIGQWDVAGIVACFVIGIGGIALGAWGVTRRDIQR
jgi:ABC-2 type transport system permease protein